jgi:predicted kinase
MTWPTLRRVPPTPPQLVVLRGNSGAGKSSVAAELRRRCGRGLALVAQDNIRRTILKELDRPGGTNIGLIEQIVNYTLANGYHVLLEGILCADHYGEMLLRLNRDHSGRAHFFYLDIELEESFVRHKTRPQAGDFTTEDMRAWYRPTDLVPGLGETLITADAGADAASPMATAERVIRESGLFTA